MEYTEEIKETLIKINDFIQASNDVNYKIRLLEREVPNLQELVKKLTIHDVAGQSEQLFCECMPDPTCRIKNGKVICNGCNKERK